MKAEHLIS